MIELDQVPELVDPVLVAAFEGWNDAGEAASRAVSHLIEVWKAETLATLESEEYYDFQVNRPVIQLDAGLTRRVTWPTTQILTARRANVSRDMVLVRGIEPNMKWRAFCDDILHFARELGVELVILLGALLADSPHTRPVPVTVAVSDSELAHSLHVELARYEGPTGIVGVLQEVCGRAGFAAVSLWASVPHYVAQPPNPKATLALLRKVEDLLDVSVPLGELPDQARTWERGVDELAGEDNDVAEYVRELEERKDATELPEASGEAIAREFERYLRRRHSDGEGH